MAFSYNWHDAHSILYFINKFLSNDYINESIDENLNQMESLHRLELVEYVRQYIGVSNKKL